MSNCTPGPWVVSVKKRNRICGPEGVIVAETWRPPARAKKGYNTAAWMTAHANAALIAAAPTLFEALTEARKFIESEYRDPAAESDGEWLAAEARSVYMAICFALADAEAS